MLKYEIIDFDLNLSDHLPVLASFQFDIDNKCTPTEYVPADDALRQIINNKRLRWDRSDCFSYYNATNNYLSPLLDLINSSYDILNKPVMCYNSMCHGKCQLCQDKRGVATNLIGRCYKGLVNTLADSSDTHQNHQTQSVKTLVG